MFKTSSKQGIEEKGGGRSNVYKTIVKQVIEGSLGYCANVPMNTGKSQFEGEVDTCTQKWKTADIYNRKSEGMLHTEKNQKGFGASSPPGECSIGINPPILSTNNKVTDATNNMLRK